MCAGKRGRGEDVHGICGRDEDFLLLWIKDETVWCVVI